MSAFLFRALYYGAQWMRGEPVASALRELEATQWKSPDELRALQWKRIRGLIDHAWETVPFYRRRWTEAGLAPQDIRSEADWRRLPMLTKDDLRSHDGAMISSRAPAGLIATTSGSSGQPAAVMRGHRSWAYAHANTIRGWRWHGVDVGDRYAYFWGWPRDAHGQGVARQKDLFFNRARLSAFDIDRTTASAFYQRLRARPARWAFGYPSAVFAFTEEVAAAGLDGRRLGWRAAVTSAEVLRDHMRERIADVFGCRVVDSYGAAEIGGSGFECEHGAMHVPIENVVLDLHATEEGEREVLLTDLHNFLQPVIRYRIGDFVAPAPIEPCPCGRGLPILGRIEGRAGDFLTLPDGRRVNGLLPYYVFRPYAKGGLVREYQFVQFPSGKIELRVIPGPSWNEGIQSELRSEMSRALGFDPAVRLVEKIQRLGRAKHRDFVQAKELGENE